MLILYFFSILSAPRNRGYIVAGAADLYLAQYFAKHF